MCRICWVQKKHTNAQARPIVYCAKNEAWVQSMWPKAHLKASQCQLAKVGPGCMVYELPFVYLFDHHSVTLDGFDVIIAKN